ncbi:unnamed protein product [Adineta ricciae]|uniref:Uncharacterized protein n=1 Tax=Adineta ricciae TaxID=249248 RepID=A0A816DGV7_ADIRI|nr:unnamed protein product [Adineta ricciae]
MTTFARAMLYFFIVYLLMLYQSMNCDHTADPISSVDSSGSTEAHSITTYTPTIVPTTSTTNKSNTSSLSTTSITSVTSMTTTTTTTTTTTEAVETTANTSEYSQSTTTPVTSTSFLPQARSEPGWWLFIALVLTIVIVVIAGVIFYHRQQSPYRRFLQNWRSHDDDTDNIILQLEPSDVSNEQWPSRISFN